MTRKREVVGSFLPVGTKVCHSITNLRHDGLEEDELEFGVVVHCWMSKEIGGYDCYVAFFGDEFPSGQPADQPYVLKYATTSLVVIS